MPFFYVYSPDDFVGGLPSESTNATSGWNSLTLKPGATPTLIEMVDDDGNFASGSGKPQGAMGPNDLRKAIEQLGHQPCA